MHSAKRQKAPSEYGTQLMEKQKLQIIYGLSNKQATNLFKSHEDKEAIFRALERRLDRVVFLLGLAKSSRIARQRISHGHILVNGKKVTIPSYTLKVGDVVAVREKSRKNKIFEELENHLKHTRLPAWLETKDTFSGGVGREPERDAGGALPFDMNLVGEFYARR